MNEAKIIVQFDADGQMEVENIPAIISPIAEDKFDVVFG